MSFAPFDFGDIAGGFGLSEQSVLGGVLGGAAKGGVSGATAGGGWASALIGAVGGAVGGYFQAEAANTMAEAALEAAQIQARQVESQQKSALDLIKAQTRLARTLGTAAPGMTPTLAGTTPTTVAGGLIPGRSFATGGDTMTILPGYQQAAMGFDINQILGGAADVLGALGYEPGTGAPPGTVQQPAGVPTGPAGLPMAGAGGLSPAGMFTSGYTSARPIREIQQVNPVTGKIHVWRHMGNPVLYSGDLATCRRVDRVAKRVAKARRRRAP